MTTIAVYSNKGGVGKTSSAVNLSYLAAQAGFTTLICDLDPQSSTTFYFRVKSKIKPKARGFLRSGRPIDRSIKGTDYPGLDLLPADFSHRNLDIKFGGLRRRRRRLDIILKPLRKEYDLIFLDCPPTINILAENIFKTSDHLLVPIIPTTLSIRAHQQLVTFLEDNGYKKKIAFGFLSMVDNENKLHRKLQPVVKKNFKYMLKTPIPYRTEIEMMGTYREPVPAFAPASMAAKSYRSLWSEIYKKILN